MIIFAFPDSYVAKSSSLPGYGRNGLKRVSCHFEAIICKIKIFSCLLTLVLLNRLFFKIVLKIIDDKTINLLWPIFVNLLFWYSGSLEVLVQIITSMTAQMQLTGR